MICTRCGRITTEPSIAMLPTIHGKTHARIICPTCVHELNQWWLLPLLDPDPAKL